MILQTETLPINATHQCLSSMRSSPAGHPHVSHIHLLVVRGNRKEACGLRSFLDVTQFTTAVLALPFQGEAKFRIEPNVADIAVRGCALVLDGAPAIHDFASNLMAASAGLGCHFLPFVACILDVGGPKEVKRALGTGTATRSGLYIHFSLGDQDVRG